jgi:hypothetical protein
MAIERCENGHVFNRDWHTECPRCPVERHAAMMKRVEITERGASDLIRRLMERYPFDATKASNDLHSECKRVLGE